MLRSVLLATLIGILAFSPPSAAAEEEEAPVLRRSFAEPSAPVPPFPEGRFEPRPGETLAWIGGTDVAELDRHGFLEAGFHLTWPDRELRWRNLAWQGDTAYRQARPLYFYTKTGDTQPGSLPDHRERTEAGILFLAFGKMESLEGLDRLSDFVAAYSGLLDPLVALSPRLVLVEPTPFFASGPAAAAVAQRNETLAHYSRAIAELAQRRGLRFLAISGAPWEAAHSDNGVHLNEGGHRLFAREVLKQLVAAPPRAVPEALRESIGRKNRLWQQYYRPSNWAFLFGDRQHVPASRDVEKREERWFVREIDALPGLIAEAESEIARYAAEATAP